MTTVVIALKIMIFFFSLPFNKRLAHEINWISFTTLVSYLFITNKYIRLFLTRIDLMVSRINNNIQRKRREMGNIRIFLLSRNGTWQIFVKEIQLNFVVPQSKCNRVLKKQKDVLNSCLIVQCSHSLILRRSRSFAACHALTPLRDKSRERPGPSENQANVHKENRLLVKTSRNWDWTKTKKIAELIWVEESL